jgi:hypothetical protein
MKRTLISINCFAAATLALLTLSSAALAGQVFIDDDIKIYDYTAAGSDTTFSTQPGSVVTGMAFSYEGVTPVLFVAAKASNEIYSYSLSSPGTQVGFESVTAPIGLAIDQNGNVYTGASSGHQLEEYASSGGAGTALETKNPNSTKTLSVDSLTVDFAGDLFEADGSGNVNELTANHTTWETIATLTGSNFDGIALDSSGDVFVGFSSAAVGGGGGIYEISSGGSVSTFYAATTVLPSGLAYDPGTSELYMAYNDADNSGEGGVDVFSSSGGTLVSTTEAIFVADGVLDEPDGIAVFTPEPGTFLLSGLGLLAISLLYLRSKNLSAR